VFAVLRVAVLAAAIALAITVLAWLITREPRWKRLSWQVFKVSVYGLLVLLVLFAGEALLRS
jgi:heme O synthase-like polyprenyltransferase